MILSIFLLGYRSSCGTFQVSVRSISKHWSIKGVVEGRWTHCAYSNSPLYIRWVCMIRVFIVVDMIIWWVFLRFRFESSERDRDLENSPVNFCVFSWKNVVIHIWMDAYSESAEHFIVNMMLEDRPRKSECSSWWCDVSARISMIRYVFVARYWSCNVLQTYYTSGSWPSIRIEKNWDLLNIVTHINKELFCK